MKPTSALSIVAVTLAALGAAYWLHAREPRRAWPKPTPPPPASDIYTDVKSDLPTEAEMEREALEHPARLEQNIEAAANSGDAQWREAAFTFLMPELLQVEPQRMLNLVARQKPGAVRDLLRTEVAHYWIGSDAPAALAWIRSLEDTERKASALTAMAAIAPVNPVQAVGLALEFDVGLRDGALENVVQRWATDEPEAARQWLETQPQEPRIDGVRDRVRARINQALSNPQSD